MSFANPKSETLRRKPLATRMLRALMSRCSICEEDMNGDDTHTHTHTIYINHHHQPYLPVSAPGGRDQPRSACKASPHHPQRGHLEMQRSPVGGGRSCPPPDTLGMRPQLPSPLLLLPPGSAHHLSSQASFWEDDNGSLLKPGGAGVYQPVSWLYGS